MKRNNFLVVMILIIWFVISFVTNILGPLMPIIIQTYKLSLTMAAFLPFSFFLAYGIMSIPAGILIEKMGEKKAMLLAFSLNLAGSLAFAIHPLYSTALSSLFVIGLGMAMLQVIINPLMRTAGGEENFAFYSVMAQLTFGLASFISPFVFTSLLHQNSAFLTFISDNLVQNDLNWTILYWLFTLIFIIILLVIAPLKIPIVKRNDDEKTGTFQVYIDLLKKREIWLFFLGIIAYVGTEQSLANWMSEFLRSYHGVDPATGGASAVAWFWGAMTFGCLLGLAVLKLWDSKIVLKTASIFSMIVLIAALYGNTKLAVAAFITLGFTISVMFSIVFSLALNSTHKHHGSFSGILCSGIFGGALVPLIIGTLGDCIGLRYAMSFLFVTLGYILFLAYRAKPIITNKTTQLKNIFKSGI
ncbi:MFS transporter [Flavobacterium collinsii]|jgi:fucose permease|uniref:Major facilitator superfamily (MFS) permease. Putative sugar:proton symporter n=1 Tax=Flavobacterium collinsii TaxID=1114861 RepID=A0A9W4TJ33_9FLAO|nr:MFS transporter [Flavobacterium collinsii]CAI2769194.1 Major facilitator superfamily (MFS) permease. Putative sugar:proton symporter [Flavobacterium collinsii]